MQNKQNSRPPTELGRDGDPIFLRPLSADGARALLHHGRHPHPDWSPGYPSAGDLEAARFHLRRCDEGRDPTPFGLFEIGLRATRSIIGGIGFHDVPDVFGATEVGYGVVPAAQGNGYATSALRCLLEFATEHEVRRIVGKAAPTNTASRRVMQKVGMHFAGFSDGLVVYEISLAAQDEPSRLYSAEPPQ